MNRLKINNNKYNLPIICKWNSEYLIGACENYGLKIFDFKNGSIPQAMHGFGDPKDIKK